MRVPNEVHQSRPWAVDEIARDFRLLDVWALPVHGGPDDFGSLLEVVTSLDPADASVPTRALFGLRSLLGRLLGWDDATEERPIPGHTGTSLSSRLPEHLRGSVEMDEPSGPLARSGFKPLYRTHDEWAAEISNATVHGVLQLSWVHEDGGRYRGRLAVYVRPRGRLGEIYLRLIEPFRHFVVYPALLGQIGRAWQGRSR